MLDRCAEQLFETAQRGRVTSFLSVSDGVRQSAISVVEPFREAFEVSISPVLDYVVVWIDGRKPIDKVGQSEV